MTDARTERRYEPASATPQGLFLLVLNAGALAAGAGAVSFYVQSKNAGAAPFTAEILGTGALLLAGATALSAARGNAVRVGPAGIAFEKGDLLRVPWHGLSRVQVEGAVLRIEGVSSFGGAVNETCSLHTHRDAAAAIVAEVVARVPAVLVGAAPESLVPRAEAGEAIALEALQIAGKRCAASGKPLAFESDGVACERCERVYAKGAKPAVCACGGALT